MGGPTADCYSEWPAETSSAVTTVIRAFSSRAVCRFATSRSASAVPSVSWADRPRPVVHWTIALTDQRPAGAVSGARPVSGSGRSSDVGCGRSRWHVELCPLFLSLPRPVTGQQYVCEGHGEQDSVGGGCPYSERGAHSQHGDFPAAGNGAGEVTVGVDTEGDRLTRLGGPSVGTGAVRCPCGVDQRARAVSRSADGTKRDFQGVGARDECPRAERPVPDACRRAVPGCGVRAGCASRFRTRRRRGSPTGPVSRRVIPGWSRCGRFDASGGCGSRDAAATTGSVWAPAPIPPGASLTPQQVPLLRPSIVCRNLGYCRPRRVREDSWLRKTQSRVAASHQTEIEVAGARSACSRPRKNPAGLARGPD